MCRGSKAEMACGHVVSHFSSPCGKKCTTPTGPTTYLDSYCERCDTEPMRQKREARKAELRIQFGLDKKPGEASCSSKIADPSYPSSSGSVYAKHKWGGRSNSFAQPRSRKAPWDAGSDSDSDDGRRDTAHLTEDGKHVIQKEFKLVNGHWALIAFRKELDEVNPILLQKLRMKREKEQEKLEEKRKRQELKKWAKECIEHDEKVRRENRRQPKMAEEEKHVVKERGRDRKGKGVDKGDNASSAAASSLPARSSTTTPESQISSQYATQPSTSQHTPETKKIRPATSTDVSRPSTKFSPSQHSPKTNIPQHVIEDHSSRSTTKTSTSRCTPESSTSSRQSPKPSQPRHAAKTQTPPPPPPSSSSLPKTTTTPQRPESARPRTQKPPNQQHPLNALLTPPPSPPANLYEFSQKANLAPQGISELCMRGPIFDGTHLIAHKPLPSSESFRARAAAALRRARLENGGVYQDYELLREPGHHDHHPYYDNDYTQNRSQDENQNLNQSHKPTHKQKHKRHYRSRSVPPRVSSKNHPWPNEIEEWERKKKQEEEEEEEEEEKKKGKNVVVCTYDYDDAETEPPRGRSLVRKPAGLGVEAGVAVAGGTVGKGKSVVCSGKSGNSSSSSSGGGGGSSKGESFSKVEDEDEDEGEYRDVWEQIADEG